MVLVFRRELPLGRVHRREVPEIAAQIEDGPGFAPAQIVGVTELRSTCAMRRFKENTLSAKIAPLVSGSVAG